MQKTEYDAEPLHIETIEKAVEAVTTHVNIQRSELFKRCRKPKTVYARQLCMYLLREKMQDDEIGKVFEMSRSWVTRHCNKLKELSSVYPSIKEDMLYLLTQI